MLIHLQPGLVPACAAGRPLVVWLASLISARPIRPCRRQETGNGCEGGPIHEFRQRGDRVKAINHGVLFICGIAMATSLFAGDSDPVPTNAIYAGEGKLSLQSTGIWHGDVGDGFRSSAQTFSIETAVALGVQAF